MLIAQADMHPFRFLKTPFDLVFNALFDNFYYPKRPLQPTHVLQICSYLGPQEVPRHDFNAFDVTFHG